MELTQGQVLVNRYRIVKLLHQGGFGSVYRAWDLNLGNACAIKENQVTSPEALQQFEREALILSRLIHPNLPRVTDYFIISGQGQYLVMDFVEGQDLDAILVESQNPLDEAQAERWISQICEAVSYMHSQKPPVIHRDIKPKNIIINPAGKALLVDFGIAKVLDPNIHTFKGARAVTAGFSPPEQYGDAATDTRSDVYALGATLYFLLTVQVPAESNQRSAGVVLTPPSTFNPQISPKAEAVIFRAMQMDPRRRYQSVQDLKMDLSAPAIPNPPPLPPTQSVGYIPPQLPQTPYPLYTPAPPAPPPQSIPSDRPVSSLHRLTRFWWVGVAALLGLCVLVCGLSYGFIKVFSNATPTPTEDHSIPVPVGSVLPPATPASVSTPVPVLVSTPIPNPITLSHAMIPAGQGTPPANSQYKYLGDLSSDYHEPLSPGNYTYHATSSANVPIYLSMGWCSKTQAILDSNWKYLKYQLTVDGQPVNMQAQMDFHDWNSDIGPCHGYHAISWAWSPGTHTITWNQSILQPINDGKTGYAPGNYIMNYVLVIQ